MDREAATDVAMHAHPGLDKDQSGVREQREEGEGEGVRKDERKAGVQSRCRNRAMQCDGSETEKLVTCLHRLLASKH